MMISLTDLVMLRSAAVDLTAEAWASLAAEHVVPCSRYRPYVQVGRDYEGVVLSGRPAFIHFSGTLERLYPAWFRVPLGQSPRWFPSSFAFEFIDATIAELARLGESGESPGDAVEITLLALVDYLDSESSSLACARRVSHLMTADRQELTIVDVTILENQRFQEARQIAEIIPTARSASNGERPTSFASPEATLVTYMRGPDPFTLPPDAERKIYRLLLALHLLYGATTADIYQVTGETTSVCRFTAHLDEFQHVEHPIAVRPAVVSQATVKPVENLLALYDATDHHIDREVVHGLQMAIIKFMNAFEPRPWFEKIVDLATALEATLSGRDKTDVTLRICMRAAIILSTETDPAPTIFADAKALYDLRSNLVHGAIITQRDLEKWLVAVSVVARPEDRSAAIRIEQLVDRLRDLVRRSILMRLLLNVDGWWRLRGNPPAIDQMWTDPVVAERWRAMWHEGAADLGAPDAVQPATPLCDSIFDSYPGKHD